MATTITTTTDTAEQVAATLGIEAPAATETPAAEATTETAAPEDERISRMTWERYQLQHQLDKAANANTELAKRIADLERGGVKTGPTTSPVTGTPTTESDDIPAYEVPKPKIDDFDTLEAWNEALVDWGRAASLHDAREIAKRVTTQVRQVDNSSRTLEEHDARLNAFESDHADFDAVAQKALSTGLPITPTMDAHFVNTESGPAMMYFLAKNPDRCKQIAALPPVRQVAALGRLEYELELAADGNTPTVGGVPAGAKPTVPTAVTKKKSTAPPAPMTPSGGGSTGSGRHPGEMNYAEFKEWRRKNGK